jgi:hypothetical protein
MPVVRFTCDPPLLGQLPPPTPAIKQAPAFYKAIPKDMPDNPEMGTVKRCVPYLDAMSAGFIIPLWADIQIACFGGQVMAMLPSGSPVDPTLAEHGYQQIPGHPLADSPSGKVVLKFMNPWLIETKPGYSCLFTAPMNHLETRIKVFDGVVDTDSYYHNVNLPFLWTGGEGVFLLPKGMPLVQVIPFRRETYELEIGPTDTDRRRAVSEQTAEIGKDAYRREYWSQRSKRKN